MLALKEKMDKELAQHDAEIKELKRVIDHNRKLKEFMSKKGKVGVFHCTEGVGLAGGGWRHFNRAPSLQTKSAQRRMRRLRR